jgi:uncharacterized protein
VASGGESGGGLMESAIYSGTLRHRRFFPARHEFTYPLFMAFLDIDRLPELMKVSPLAAYNRWNWVSYHDRDHFGDPRKSLRERLLRDAQRHNVELPQGRTFLLTHLRYLGYNFNPVSFYYCYDLADKLQAIVAEVNNTFGETENYWLTQTADQHPSENKRYRFPKTFHVSPFMKLGHEYDWTFTPPGERLITESVSYEGGCEIFDSTLKLERREWTPRELHTALLRFPWVTAKVIAAIHWQALRLLMKKVPVVPHPGKGHFERATAQHWGASWRAE